jgi:hypothetical protein
VLHRAGHAFGSGWGGVYGDMADAAAAAFFDRHLRPVRARPGLAELPPRAAPRK